MKLIYKKSTFKDKQNARTVNRA